MARPTDTKEPRDQYVRTRVTATEKAQVDRLRGSISESNWVRGLIAAEVERQGPADAQD